jgi:hypothetical protein
LTRRHGYSKLVYMMMSQKDLIQILQADMEARGDKMLSVWVWDREGFNGANGLDMIETQWDAVKNR